MKYKKLLILAIILNGFSCKNDVNIGESQEFDIDVSKYTATKDLF